VLHFSETTNWKYESTKQYKKLNYRKERYTTLSGKILSTATKRYEKKHPKKLAVGK